MVQSPPTQKHTKFWIWSGGWLVLILLIFCGILLLRQIRSPMFTPHQPRPEHFSTSSWTLLKKWEQLQITANDTNGSVTCPKDPRSLGWRCFAKTIAPELIEAEKEDHMALVVPALADGQRITVSTPNAPAQLQGKLWRLSNSPAFFTIRAQRDALGSSTLSQSNDKGEFVIPDHPGPLQLIFRGPSPKLAVQVFASQFEAPQNHD